MFIHSSLIFSIAIIFATVKIENVSADYLSRTMSIDELLFSNDLFPGHVIPEKTHHSDALKLFQKAVEDPHTLTEAYEKYRVQHNKNADPEHEERLEIRRSNFRENLHMIFSQNLQADAGNSRFQLGVNDFADMSREELKQFLGSNDKLNFPIHPKHNPTGPQGPASGAPQGPLMSPPAQFPGSNASAIHPIYFDFRDDGLVSPIKNQRKCGSCVFFSYAGFMEILYALRHSSIVNLSEQMMLDCATAENGYVNNAGCHGNIMEDTAQFLQDVGVTLEDVYKYEAKQGNCTKDGKPIVAQLKDYWQVEPTVEAFKDTLVNQKLPIAAAFLVYHQFMFYRAGVFDMCTPPNGPIGGHAVLITGYGHFIDQGYWIVKNSWGVNWGEMGFFKYASGAPFCRFERWGFTGTLL